MSVNMRLLTALTLSALLPPLSATAQESERCTDATLHGSYGLHATGTNAAGQPFAAVGRFTFDGMGNLTGHLFTNVNGNNGEREFAGTYSVSPDCIVTDFWGAPVNSTHISVITEKGKGYVILNTTVGSGTISGDARRQ
jgi:hypothetical protein